MVLLKIVARSRYPVPWHRKKKNGAFAPDIICAPRSTRSLLSTASGSGRPARRESRWPVDVARLASRRRAHAHIRARQRAQHHAFIFVHADLQPTCSMIVFMAEQRLLACSKRNRRANTIRAVPPFSRLQNACSCPTCSTPCSCDCSPASSAMCTGFGRAQPDEPEAATRAAKAAARHAQGTRAGDRHQRRFRGCSRSPSSRLGIQRPWCWLLAAGAPRT